MLPLSGHTLGSGDALAKRPVLTLFGDGFTVWKWHAEAAKALFLQGDVHGEWVYAAVCTQGVVHVSLTFTMVKPWVCVCDESGGGC